MQPGLHQTHPTPETERGRHCLTMAGSCNTQHVTCWYTRSLKHMTWLQMGWLYSVLAAETSSMQFS